MFGLNHLVWLLLSGALVALLTVVSVKKKFTLREAAIVMSVIGAGSEISKMMSNMLPSSGGGMHLDPQCLPFHLCSLMLFAVFFVAFGKDGKIKDKVVMFLAPMGIMGSVLALLIPTNGTDFFTPDAYQCFIYHAGLLWFGIYLLLSKTVKLGLKEMVENTVILLCLSLLMIYINGALAVYDTNFFYLTRPPLEGLPFLNLEGGWYVYFLKIVLIGLAALVLFHLPFIFGERKKRRAEEKRR